MKRICSWCNKEMGFKCPACESQKLTVEHVGQFDIATCGDCGYAFPLSAAVPTNGICPACAAEFLKSEGAQ
jgi:transcription elongation factor Elf1